MDAALEDRPQDTGPGATGPVGADGLGSDGAAPTGPEPERSAAAPESVGSAAGAESEESLAGPEPDGAGDGGDRPVRAAVVGAGSWGTTFAAVLADAGCTVRVWGRDPQACRSIAEQRRNERYLPGVLLPEGIEAGTDAAWALQGADLVAVAVPCRAARDTLGPMRELIGERTVVVSLMKGIELGTDLRMSQLVAQALGLPEARVAVLSGPNLAKEIARRMPTATVVAGGDEDTTRWVARACATAYFRPYTNTDTVGVELCGAVKNVIALAVGMAHGQGYGQNTVATVITRGLAEITRLGLAMGARAETFAGLAGMGDLVATCSSTLSRNHTLGSLIGRGRTLAQAVAETGTTAEGVTTSRSVLELADRLGVEMPITAAVNGVLHHDLPVAEMTTALLARPHKAEGR